MSNTLLIKRSATPGATPSTSNLALGELAVNTYDGRLYTKIDTGVASIYELTQNQPITVTGNVTGVSVNAPGNTSIALTLSNTGVSAGTYGGTSGATSNIGVFTVDQYGRITSASNVAISTSSLANGTANIQIFANGNISISPAGTANVVVVANTGQYITGLLSVSGNITSGNLSTTGNVAANGVLTDNYYYANGTPVDFQQAAGSNTQIQYNNNNDFGASANFTFNSATNLLTVTGTSSTTGNVIGGNITTAGLVTATGNVTGGNVVTGGLITATGNATAGNVNTGGQVSATGNVTGGNLLTGGIVSATGNATAGNVNTGGQVSATGNVTGGNIATAGLVTATGNMISAANIAGGNVIATAAVSAGGIVSAAGNAIAGNINTAGLVSAVGNVIGGNVVTAGLITATGNVTGGNITTGGLVTASGNIISTANVTGGNLTTGGLVTATGNVTGGNIATGGLVTATGNVTGGNLTTGGLVTATGNVTGGNLNTSGTASITGNVISGNLSTGIITASGNVTGANYLTGGLISATGNVNGGNLIAATAVVTPTVTSTAAMTISTGSGNLLLSPAGNINVDNKYINNLANPVQSFDAATKQYVDDAVSTGITIHTPVLVESPVALSATYAQGGTTHTVTDITTGNTLTFSASHGLSTNDQIYWSSAFNGILANTSYFVFSVANATAVTLANIYGGPQLTGLTNATGLSETGRANPGVGATLTATANGAANIDGVLVSANARVLVYQQANAVHNGVYVVTNTGNVSAPWVFTRSSDTNTYQPASINGLDAGDYFFVQSGDTGAGESYVLTAPVGEIILGYDNLTFTQFSASQVYTANTAAGISLTGTVFSAKVDNNTTAFDGGGNIIVKASANLTTPNIGDATGDSVSVSGNITGANVNYGAGVLSGTGNVIAGNVVTSGLMSATGNITGGNVITGGIMSATGNITGGNILTGGLISVAGTVTAANLQLSDTANVATLIVRTFANITATTTSTSNVTGALRVAGGVGVTGNVYADGMYVLGDSVLTVNSTIDCGTY